MKLDCDPNRQSDQKRCEPIRGDIAKEVFVMFGLTRWNPFDEIFNVQRDVERMFDNFWNDLPARTAASRNGGFQVKTNDEGWRIDIPIPGLDPQHVSLEASGHTLSIRAGEGDAKNGNGIRYEQSFTVPQFLDLDKLSASYRHGMLELTLPLKDSVKPLRIQIEGTGDTRKRIASAA
jgi:HSP20 family protein